MNKVLLILIGLTILTLSVHAQTLGVQQTLGQLIPASPTAAAIATYQNYPVDYMTGSPQVSIPLMELQTKMGKIPLELSYNIGRIKTSELTGPAGLGWTLMPNLGISRAVRGVPDDISTGYGSNPQFGDQSDCLYLLNLSREFSEDGQPDDFYYSLLGNSGRFIYRQNKSFSSIPFAPIKVTHNTSQSFSITDADGTIYNFGKYSVDDGNQYIEWTKTNGVPIPTSWKITEIISYDKTDTIKFMYTKPITQWDVPYYTNAWKIIHYPERPDLQPKIYMTQVNSDGIIGWTPMRPASITGSLWGSTDPMTVYDVIPEIADFSQFCISSNGFPANCGLDFGSFNADATLLTDHYIDEMPLTDILFRGGKLSISYSGTQMSSIILYAGTPTSSYTQVKRVDLFQHTVPFSTSQPVGFYNNKNYRYLLDSVVYRDLAGHSESAYQLQYTSRPGDAGAPPLAGGFASDMFGFPNYSLSVGVIPAMPIEMGYTYCQLTETTQGTWLQQTVPSSSAIMGIGSKQFFPPGATVFGAATVPSGILQQLTYPTGGTASFDFENNLFSLQTNSEIVAGGGYRIRDIRYTAGSGTDSMVRSYRYGQNENGGGVLKFVPNSQDFMSQQTVNSTHIGDASNIVQQIITVNSSPHKDISFGDGAAVWYPVVTEYIGTPQGNAGKTVYTYNFSDLNDTRLPDAPLQEDYRDEWRMSSLASTQKFRYSQGNYTPVERTDYTYRDTTVDAVPVEMAFQQYVSLQPTSTEDQEICSSSSYLPHTSYLSFTITPGAKLTKQMTTTTYDPDDVTQFVQKTTNYEYDPSTLQLASQTTNDSKNEVWTTKTWYPGNAGQIPGWPAAQNAALAFLQSANRLNTTVQQQTLKSNSPVVTVQHYYSTAGNGQLYPSQVWAQMRNNPIEQKASINQYDTHGNIVEQQKVGDVREVYLWGYNGLYPVAKIIGSTYATVSALVNQSVLDNPVTTDAQMQTELNKIRTGLPHVLVNTYTYKPLFGITSQIDPSGKTTYYEYDAASRLMLIRDKDNNIIKTFQYHYKGY
jgi:YD repeat-containing protein